ncbi:MAG TPA: sugar phosphate isomerase/epimerase family protein [Planctomycetaceae bacterium]|nr:sugar phosphate isomerase/epimerase family protein [Planctomycetaceae bacterium]
MIADRSSSWTHASNRRQFLQFAVAGGLTLTLGRLPGASAAEPVKRNGKPHLKLSLAAYSYLDFLTKKENPMHLDDFVRLCADFNLDGTELTSYYFPKDFSEDYLIHLKQLTFRLGLDISGTAIANDFCLPVGPEREKTLAHTRKWIDYAALMGAPVIRIFAGNVPKGDSEEAAIARCSAGINEALEYAARKGVCLALENHGGITATPEQMLRIIAGVKESPWFGVNLDGGNFHGADPYSELARIAPYAINAQLKTDITPASGKREDADLERVVRILADAGYRGYIVLEYEGKEDPKTAVPRHLDSLRKIIRAV